VNSFYTVYDHSLDVVILLLVFAPIFKEKRLPAGIKKRKPLRPAPGEELKIRFSPDFMPVVPMDEASRSSMSSLWMGRNCLSAAVMTYPRDQWMSNSDVILRMLVTSSQRLMRHDVSSDLTVTGTCHNCRAVGAYILAYRLPGVKKGAVAVFAVTEIDVISEDHTRMNLHSRAVIGLAEVWT